MIHKMLLLNRLRHVAIKHLETIITKLAAPPRQRLLLQLRLLRLTRRPFLLSCALRLLLPRQRHLGLGTPLRAFDWSVRLNFGLVLRLARKRKRLVVRSWSRQRLRRRVKSSNHFLSRQRLRHFLHLPYILPLRPNGIEMKRLSAPETPRRQCQTIAPHREVLKSAAPPLTLAPFKRLLKGSN